MHARRAQHSRDWPQRRVASNLNILLIEILLAWYRIHPVATFLRSATFFCSWHPQLESIAAKLLFSSCHLDFSEHLALVEAFELISHFDAFILLSVVIGLSRQCHSQLAFVTFFACHLLVTLSESTPLPSLLDVVHPAKSLLRPQIDCRIASACRHNSVHREWLSRIELYVHQN